MKAISLIYYLSYLIVPWGSVTDWLYFIYAKMIFLSLEITQGFAYRAMIIPLQILLLFVSQGALTVSIHILSDSLHLPPREIVKDKPAGGEGPAWWHMTWTHRETNKSKSKKSGKVNTLMVV